MTLRALGLLLALLLALGPAYAKDVAPADAITTWLAATPATRGVHAARVRKLGPKAVPALKAARAHETAAAARIDRLLADIRADFHRAKTPVGMIYVPAGTLQMPRPAKPWGPSGVRQSVAGFYIDRTEVTVGAWRAWMAKLAVADRTAPRRLGLRLPAPDTEARLPITQVRHIDAVRFATDRGGRLPTAEEFERALRGAGHGTYPWGDRMRKGFANLAGWGAEAPMPVGSHPTGASGLGVQDLVGNVAEWSATERRQGTRGRYPLVLGGSYRDGPDPALTWRGRDRMRAPIGPRERRAWIGFRVVRPLPALPR